jgi:MOSC domain-containing protein YiiM
MVKRFQRSGRSGFYFRVLREGEIARGDPIELVSAARSGVSVAEIVRRSGIS